jgi:hypothetical protein
VAESRGSAPARLSSAPAGNGVANTTVDRYLSPVINNSADTFSLASRRVIRFSVAFVVLVVIANGLGLAGLTAFKSGAADPTSFGSQASVAVIGTAVGFVTLVCILGLLISAVVWIISAHLVRPSGPSFVGYGSLVLCALLIVFAYVIPERMSTDTATAAVGVAMRVGGAIVLILGVILVRGRISRHTGQPVQASAPSLVTTEDWDASQWDPEVQHDIERRRRTE